MKRISPELARHSAVALVAIITGVLVGGPLLGQPPATADPKATTDDSKPAADEPAPDDPAAADDESGKGKAKDDTDSPKDDADAPKVDPTAPRGPAIENYEPPSQPHRFLAIEKELVEPEELQAFKFNQLAFNTAMNEGSLSGSNRKIVEDGIRVLVLRLSLKSNRDNLAVARAEMERWIQRAAMKPGVDNTARRTFRAHMLDHVIKHCKALLDGNLKVRFQAMLLLNECTIQAFDRIKRTPEEFYVPVYPTFLEILQDHEQHDVVRVWAAKGLRRVLERGTQIRNAQRNEIAQVLATELLSGRNVEWLDMRIAETCGSIGVVRFGGGKPFVIDALSRVLSDPTRSWIVRSESAKQLARAEPDAKSNLSLFAHQTAKLVEEMAAAQAKQPKSAKWRVCFLNAYLAFVPKNRDELHERKAGFAVRADKTAHDENVKAALAVVAPVVNHVLGEDGTKPIEAKLVEPLTTWLQSSAPKDLKPTPDLEPLEVNRVAESPPMTEPAG